jgi:trimethylamine--corrinoid protein Co-methyltransferase
MARARITFLDEREEALIHEQSLKWLQEIGVKILSPSVLELLGDRGAAIDRETRIAKIPPKMVEAALDSAPKTFTLCARDPKHDLQMPAHPIPYATTSGLAVFVVDLETGEYRSSTCNDIAELSRLADALDPIDFLWTSLTATDVPALAHGPHEVWTTMQNTTKHVQGVTVQSAEDARVQIELAALIAGGKEALRERPLLSVISCPVAPLVFESGAIEAQVEFAKAGVPICSMSMSMSAATAPVTISGTITNANVENLASLVITQAAAPGSPHIYTSESAPMDMRNGSMNYSAPEKTLFSFGLGQMAKRYGLPCLVADIGFGDDFKGGMSPPLVLANQFVGIMGNSDIITGIGCVDDAKGMCLKQMVVDAYLWECLCAYMKQVEVTEETIGFEAAAEVGPGRDFLKSKHTRKYLRSDLTFWDQTKVDLLEKDSADMVVEAKIIAKAILKDHVVPPLDEDLLRKGDEIIRAYEKQVG